MTLYVSIVLLAELAALPDGRAAGGGVRGPVGWELVAILWGTTIGLVLAHAFAFQVATHGLSGGRLRADDRSEVLAELGGASFVSAIASMPVLWLPDDVGQELVPFVLVVIIGAVAYVVERANGRSRATSIAFGVGALVIGVGVALLKLFLAYH